MKKIGAHCIIAYAAPGLAGAGILGLGEIRGWRAFFKRVSWERSLS